MDEEEFHDQPPDPEDLEALAKWEPPPKPGSLVGLLPNKWVRRLVLGALPLLTLAFGSGLIAASQLAVSHALQVFGTAEGGKATTAKQLRAAKVRGELVAGRPNALRLGVWNRRLKRHERHFKAKVELRGYQLKPLILFQGASGPGHALDANFVLPPKLKPGFYKLWIRAIRSDDTFTTTLPVRVVDGSKPLPAVVTDPPKPGTKPVLTPVGPDGVLFEILPPVGRRIASELTEHLTVRATDESGNPRQIQLEIRLKGGLLAKARPGKRVAGPVKTDVLGIYDLDVCSRRLSVKLEGKYKTTDGNTATNTFSFAQRTAQAAILPDKLIVKPGEEVGVTVQTKDKSGYIYLEGVARGHRFQVLTKSVSRARARVTLVAPRQPGLFRIQATDDFATPGKGIASRSLFVDATPGDHQVLMRLAKAVRPLLDADDKRTQNHVDKLLASGLLADKRVNVKRTAAYLLSRLDDRHCPTAWLADTSAADAKALKKKRRRFQTMMLLGLCFTALLLLAVVLPMIYTNILLHRQGAAERDALMAEFEGEQAAGGDKERWHDEDHDWRDEAHLPPQEQARRAQQRAKLARLQHIVQITVVTGVIVLAVAMMLALLLNLTWSVEF